ncbi:MAG: hypothetical protein PHR77_05510 [Kiritimatiellae bacterium]|nr:hypothetical protein [Kiritimatiellia bacterium]
MKPVSSSPAPTPAPKTANASSQVTPRQPLKQNETKVVRNNPAVTVLSSTSKSLEENLPPAAKDLKVMWSDPNGGSKSRITCTFGVPKLSPPALEAQKQKGMIPYRITATITMSPPPGTVENDKWAVVRTGPCLVRLFDENNTEIFTATMQADKMCPS